MKKCIKNHLKQQQSSKSIILPQCDPSPHPTLPHCDLSLDPHFPSLWLITPTSLCLVVTYHSTLTLPHSDLSHHLHFASLWLITPPSLCLTVTYNSTLTLPHSDLSLHPHFASLWLITPPSLCPTVTCHSTLTFSHCDLSLDSHFASLWEWLIIQPSLRLTVTYHSMLTCLCCDYHSIFSLPHHSLQNFASLWHITPSSSTSLRRITPLLQNASFWMMASHLPVTGNLQRLLQLVVFVVRYLKLATVPLVDWLVGWSVMVLRCTEEQQRWWDQ